MRIVVSFLAACLFAALAIPTEAETLSKVATGGRPLKLWETGRVDQLTCQTDTSVNLVPNVTVQPRHGKLSVVAETAIFQGSGGSPCRGKPFTAKVLYYTADKQFRGEDTLTITTTRSANRMPMAVDYVFVISVK